MKKRQRCFSDVFEQWRQDSEGTVTDVEWSYCNARDKEGKQVKGDRTFTLPAALRSGWIERVKIATFLFQECVCV